MHYPVKSTLHLDVKQLGTYGFLWFFLYKHLYNYNYACFPFGYNFYLSFYIQALQLEKKESTSTKRKASMMETSHKDHDIKRQKTTEAKPIVRETSKNSINEFNMKCMKNW